MKQLAILFIMETAVQRKLALIILLLIILPACASPAQMPDTDQTMPVVVAENSATIQPTFTATPSPTITRTPTPTFTPTSTPYAQGGIPRIAILTRNFVEGSDPVGKDSKYVIRIGYLEPGGNSIQFSNDEIFACLDPYLQTTCFISAQAPLRWSPNGRYLAFIARGENSQVKLSIYDAQEKTLVREALVTRKNINNIFDIGWSPDSAWFHADLDGYLYVAGIESEAALSASPNRTQSPKWDAEKSILYYEDSQGNKLFQFDPAKNQSSEISRKQIKSQHYKDASSWYSYSQYEPGLKSETAVIINKDDTRSIYLLNDDETPTEFLRVSYDVIQHYQDAHVLPAPDGSAYLYGGYASIEGSTGKGNFLFGLVIPAGQLPYQASGNFINGILPLAWAPNSKAYMGIQISFIGETWKMSLNVMDASGNQPLQEYNLNAQQIFNTHKFTPEISYLQGRGVTGFDVFWPSQSESSAPIKKPYAVYTMTPTPTDVPRWAALENLRLYDDFSNNNLEKWKVSPGFMAEGKQVTGLVEAKDGVLVFAPDAALSYAEVMLHTSLANDLNAQTGIVMEARFKLQESSQTSFRFELSSGINNGPVIECDNAWGSTDFYCGVVKFADVPNFEYRTTQIPITIGEWHKMRIEIDPQTAAIQFYFDNALIGRHIPNDFVRLKRATYTPAIILGIGNPSTPIFIDDIYTGTVSGSIQYIPTLTPTSQQP